MPVIFPNQIPDPEEYVLIPQGEYSVEVSDVKEKTTRYNDVMFAVTLQITAGKFVGKKLFTNLVFSEGGLGNVKVFCKSAGFAMDIDRLELRPESIERATLRATVVHEEYKGEIEKLKGKMQAKIPYAGFASLLDKPSPPPPPPPLPVQGQGSLPTAKPDQFSDSDIPF